MFSFAYSLTQFAAGPITIDHNQVGLPAVATDNTTLAGILNAVFIVIGAGAILIIVLAAFSFITSNGDPGKAKRAREAIMYAAIGLVVCLTAFSLVQVILGRVFS